MPTFKILNLSKKPQYDRESEFVKSFFHHNNWYYEPVRFKFSPYPYTPDFYDVERDLFIEVVGSRQAYCKNRRKYKRFKIHYPDKLELRKPDGSLFISPKIRRRKKVVDERLSLLEKAHGRDGLRVLLNYSRRRYSDIRSGKAPIKARLSQLLNYMLDDAKRKVQRG